MKEIIETTWPRDPDLNEEEAEEFKRLKKELEYMGLFVFWDVQVGIDNKGNIKIKADIDVTQSRDSTIH